MGESVVGRGFSIARHLNKLRWITLSFVFLMLIVLPYVYVYQTFVAAHAYDFLAESEKQLYDVVEFFTAPLTNDPAEDLDALKGTTWSGSFFGVTFSDPLAALSHISASKSLYLPLLLSSLIPIGLTIVFGRFFCGWICPATFLYELNTNFGALLNRLGVPLRRRHFDHRLKYVVLAIVVALTAATGSIIATMIYPPAVIGREIFYAIALNGFGAGAIFFVFTLLVDLLVARRGFCRYLCPGGALYSLLGRYRIVRIQRVVENCNDCEKCNAICEFGLDPLHDDFGQECNNCTACIAVCPTDALTFRMRLTDQANQGPGHLGRHYHKNNTARQTV